MSIAFFGTPDFAVPSLRALLGEGFDVSVVVTQPDKPQNRSRSKLVAPPVKVVAEEEGLEILQPTRPTDPEFVERLSELKPSIGVVVAYGHILKRELLDLPERGMINVHASLLPRHRGAAPIQHSILAGDEQSGVSIMQLDEGMDTGPVLHTVPTPVLPDETAGELTARLSELGALALVEALGMLFTESVEAVPQDHVAATHAPKISRADARIDWSHSATDISRRIRAMDPAPGAWARFGGDDVKLFGPRIFGEEASGTPGEVLKDDPALVVAAGEGALQLLEVQPAGKRRMAAVDWLRGVGDIEGSFFE